jgi:hypothetical protein
MQYHAQAVHGLVHLHHRLVDLASLINAERVESAAASVQEASHRLDQMLERQHLSRREPR